MESLTIKSAEGSATVTFTADGRDCHGETQFNCDLRAEGFSGRVTVCQGYRNLLSEYFLSLASSWRGWNGARSWMSDGDKIRLDASADESGHVTLKVALRTYGGTNLTARILIEAGALSQIADDVERLLGCDACSHPSVAARGCSKG